MSDIQANAALLTESIVALENCDDVDYRIDMMLAYRPEIVSTMRALLSALSAAEARAEAAEARVRELSEALKPFAVIVSNHPEMDSASSVITLTYNKAHLRNAARTLKGAPDGR